MDLIICFAPKHISPMKIERVISEGEKISENQMIDLCGGSSLMANENHALGCGCRGTGDNTNTSYRLARI